MIIKSILQYSYLNLWGLLDILAISHISIFIMWGLIVALLKERFKVVSLIATILVNVFAIPIYAGSILWVIMLLINIGHWIGMY